MSRGTHTQSPLRRGQTAEQIAAEKLRILVSNRMLYLHLFAYNLSGDGNKRECWMNILGKDDKAIICQDFVASGELLLPQDGDLKTEIEILNGLAYGIKNIFENELFNMGRGLGVADQNVYDIFSKINVGTDNIISFLAKNDEELYQVLCAKHPNLILQRQERIIEEHLSLQAQGLAVLQQLSIVERERTILEGQVSSYPEPPEYVSPPSLSQLASEAAAVVARNNTRGTSVSDSQATTLTVPVKGFYK